MSSSNLDIKEVKELQSLSQVTETVLSDNHDSNGQKELEKDDKKLEEECREFDLYISKLYNDFEKNKKDFEETNAELEKEHQNVKMLKSQNLLEIQIDCAAVNWVSTNETCFELNKILNSRIDDCILSIRTYIYKLENRLIDLKRIKGMNQALIYEYDEKVKKITDFLNELMGATFTNLQKKIKDRHSYEISELYNLRDMINKKCKGGGKTIYTQGARSLYTNENPDDSDNQKLFISPAGFDRNTELQSLDQVTKTVLSENHDSTNDQNELEEDDERLNEECREFESFISVRNNEFERIKKDFEETNTELEKEHERVLELFDQNLTENQINCKELIWVSTSKTYEEANNTLGSSINNCQTLLQNSIRELQNRYSSLSNSIKGVSLKKKYEKTVRKLSGLIAEISGRFINMKIEIYTRQEAERKLTSFRNMISRKCRGGTVFRIPDASMKGLDRENKDDKKKELKIDINKDQVSISEKIRSIICRH